MTLIVFRSTCSNILMFSREYPNSGQLKTMLSDIDKRIKEWLEPYEEEITTLSLDDDKPVKTKKITKRKRLVGGTVLSMTAIATQIALENVSVSHYALRIISRMIDSLKDMKEKQSIINKVYNKLCKQPNSDYNQLWLQNMTYTQDKMNGNSPYTLRLCKLVTGEAIESLWNNDWLQADIVGELPYDSIINKEILKKVTPVITFRETRIYNETF